MIPRQLLVAILTIGAIVLPVGAATYTQDMIWSSALILCAFGLVMAIMLWEINWLTARDSQRRPELGQYEYLLGKLAEEHRKYRSLIAKIDRTVGKHNAEVHDLDSQARSLLQQLGTLGYQATMLAHELSEGLGVSEYELRALDERYHCD